MRSRSLDGIRGIAILLVFLSHASGRDQSLIWFLDFHGIGQVGVYLFFVLSGFLLADNLIAENNRHGRISLSHYFTRRFFRIAPLYFFVVTVTFLIQQFNGIQLSYLHVRGGLIGYLRHLFFVQGDSVFWTIPVEISFYLILPFVMLLLFQNRKFVYGLLAFAILYFAWFIGVQFGPLHQPLRLIDIAHKSQFLDVFICGVLAAILFRSEVVTSFYQRNKKVIASVASVSFITVLIFTFSLISKNFLGLGQPFYNFRFFSLPYGVVFAFAVLVARFETNTLSRLLSQKILTFVGMVSFSWYLVHFPVLQVVNHFQLQSMAKFPISLLLSAGLSWLSYTVIEQPFIRFGKRITTVKVPALENIADPASEQVSEHKGSKVSG